MDLVVQAPHIEPVEIGALADVARARGIRVIEGGGQETFRLIEVTASAALTDACGRGAFDHALVSPDLQRERVGLVAMDMDSTLITIECIDEIADMLGIKPQVAAITASAMRGEIDFAQSLTRRVALLAGLSVDALQRVYDERLRLSPGAERMLQGFKAVGAKTLLVSGGFTFFTERLRERLALDETLSNLLEVENGNLTGRIHGSIVDARAKAQRFAELRDRYARAGGIAVAIGDGANDVPMLERADVSIAYHAKPVVRERTTYAINHCGLDAVLNLFG